MSETTRKPDAHEEYWRDALGEAFEAIDRFDIIKALTNEQIDDLAACLRSCEENKSQGFYTPPASDRIHAIEQEATAPLLARIKTLEAENRVYVDSVKRRRGASEVFIENGEVVYRR